MDEIWDREETWVSSCISCRLKEIGFLCGYKWKEQWVLVPNTAWCLTKVERLDILVLEEPIESWNDYNKRQRRIEHHGLGLLLVDYPEIFSVDPPRHLGQVSALTDSEDDQGSSHAEEEHDEETPSQDEQGVVALLVTVATGRLVLWQRAVRTRPEASDHVCYHLNGRSLELQDISHQIIAP